MRWFPSTLCALSALAALVASVPLPEARPGTLQDMQASMPLEVQERLSALTLEEQQLEQVTRDKRTIGIIRQLFPGVGQTELNPEENQLAGAESQVNEVRTPFAGAYVLDQDAAASGGNDAPDPATDAITLEDENAEDAERNKRQFSLGGGSGGGSGNFLFDIIRLVTGGSAGGSSGGAGATATATNEASTDASGAPASEKAEDGYGSGVPGPVTRLFIIANRGIANLIQDLILRIAQTSERLVNFKARLITSII